MTEQKTYKVDIEIERTKDGWRGKSWIHGVQNEFHVTRKTATDVLDCLMVDLKDTMGSVLDTKEEVDYEVKK